MFCTNCGAALPDDAKHCTSCGAPAPVLGDEEVAGSGEGAPVDVDVSALDEPTKLEDASAPKHKGMRPAAIAAIAIAVVAVLVGAGRSRGTSSSMLRRASRRSSASISSSPRRKTMRRAATPMRKVMRKPKAPMQRLTIRYRRVTGLTPLRLTARIPVPR